MTQVQGPPPGATIVEDAPPTEAGGGRRRRDPAPRTKMPPGRWFREIGWRHLVGVLAVVWALFPVSYLVSASLNPLGNVVTSTMIPRSFSLDNFTQLIDEQPFGTWYRNSIIVCICVVFVQLLFSTFAAYAFSRFRFKGRRGGLLALLLIQMFPQFLAAVALYLMFTEIGEVIPAVGLDTLPGYILMMCGGSLGQVWLIKGFFDSIPMSLDEAAMIDGASHVQVFFRIILPLLQPILAVCGLLVFVGVMGEFLMASIFLRDEGNKTLATGLYGLIDADRSNNLGVFAAGSIMTAIPVVLLFLYLQKFIVGGITAGGVKG
ncbi:sugar ABC transporter permease [Nocardioides okcheonensis]|uniref:sugar ABC transporter permease n=1 Tax=Nocardioides okcheonensis TaxID=2894081 RepID=UPI001E4F67FA|nr:sugar ABC transporter permease [Nocardioides okcheonensis]UFN43157.1 sugar ABC transporter permease [Nocardioides okcheonensis]